MASPPAKNENLRRTGPLKAGHYCGVMGAFGIPNAGDFIFNGLYSLQHRGQESAGIAISDGEKIQSLKGLGLLSEAIAPEDVDKLRGKIGIGHVRYSTTGTKRVQNIQPLVIEYSRGIVAIGHNGNLTNAQKLRNAFEARGSIFQTSTDSEIIVHLLADPEHIENKDPLASALEHVEGAYSAVLMDARNLYAFRDPYGWRPLSIGKLGDGYVVASETCAFDLLGARFVRDVRPGEIVRFSSEGVESSQFAEPQKHKRAQCIFEHVYFARPDSILFGETVHEVRVRLGERLALDAPAEADAVISVPHSGDPAALGFSRRSGLPLEQGFISNKYVGRTFITPTQKGRCERVELKLNVVREVVEGKRLVVVDDSIVRGTTCRGRLDMLRQMGAKELHMRVSAPPVRNPCFFGIDFPTREELIAAHRSDEEIRKFLGVDTLAYQSTEGLLAAVNGAHDEYCLACFTGDYPIAISDCMDKNAFENRCRV